jgi:hypothetical protein
LLFVLEIKKALRFLAGQWNFKNSEFISNRKRKVYATAWLLNAPRLLGAHLG